ncbi:MAG: multifunctional CCA addition/repair protein [Gammaproteobacteria bacterium]
MMQTFLVGGAVRDELLGLPVKERDWVVVGETPEVLLRKGFRPVGKEFPVFLHPETHEEYALARTERKIAPGYRGFSIQTSPEVTLEQDLMRRDLTINAIARDTEGRIIDPCHGRKDLELRLLRHVSDAFCEDPVRILRVARFAARYADLGFSVARETNALMKSMVEAGEVDALVPERVWSEFVRALAEKTPVAFITVLRECGAFERLFPEIERLFGLILPRGYRVKDAGENALLALENASRITENPRIRFAALVHGIGASGEPETASCTDQDTIASGLAALNRFCARLKAPRAYHGLAEQVLACQELGNELFLLSAERILELLRRLKALRKGADLNPFVTVLTALSRGRKDHPPETFPQGEFLLQCQTVALSVDGKSALKQGLSGTALGAQVNRLRIAALNDLIDRTPQCIGNIEADR